MTDAATQMMDVRPASPAHFLADFFSAAAATTRSSAASTATEAARRANSAHSEVQGATTAWMAKDWLESLGVTDTISAAMLAPLGGADAARPAVQLAYIRGLASTDDSTGIQCVRGLLSNGGHLDALAGQIWRGVQSLARAPAAHAAELHAKFCAEGSSFTMSFAGLSTFFGGLEALIGPPHPSLLDAMTSEHCAAADSQLLFTTPNYGVETTSEVEWLFVTEPHMDTLERLRRPAWPAEHPRYTDEITRRKPVPLSRFHAQRLEANAQLEKEGVAPVGDAEFIACRLYTGPLFVKYNLVLRGLSALVPHLVEQFELLCHGNRYVTTLHACNSAVVKLGKLTRAATVYRGVSGLLPDEFWTPNQWGVRGGTHAAI